MRGLHKLIISTNKMAVTAKQFDFICFLLEGKGIKNNEIFKLIDAM